MVAVVNLAALAAAALVGGCSSSTAGACCEDPAWAAWPMPNAPADVADGAPNAMAYTLDGAGESATDLVTSLMWQRAVSPGQQLTWREAISSCASLTLGGHGDWRLPTEIELVSLIDDSIVDPPTIDRAAFPNTPSGYVWSSIPMAGSPDNAWLVDFNTGSAYSAAVDAPEYVRCVRPTARAAAPAPHYAISTGTVYDTRTKLTWQRSVPAPTYAWNDAATLCSSGEIAALGGSGWRLPTKKELLTLVDYAVEPPGPTIDVAAFPDTPGGSYWSISPLAASVPGRWFVDFTHGYAADYAEGPTSHVRCVR